jgi:hypothetical protein
MDMESTWNRHGIDMESTWNPHRNIPWILCRFHMEFTWNPHRIHGIFVFQMKPTYSTWNPFKFHGIFIFHMDSIYSPYGIWGQDKVLHMPMN